MKHGKNKKKQTKKRKENYFLKNELLFYLKIKCQDERKVLVDYPGDNNR